jgi:hypothetical protein
MKKNIIHAICTIVTVLAFRGLFCQTPVYFSKAFCPEGIAASATNVLLTDSGYIVAGAYKDSTHLYQRLYLMHIDHNGNTNKISTHGNDTMKYFPGNPTSIIQANDSDFFWVCQKANVVKSMGALLRINPQFNVIWEADYPCNNDTTYSFLGTTKIYSSNDKGFIISGSIESNHYATDLLLQKTDSLGNIQWRKQFVYYGETTGWSVIQTPDHGYLVGGGAYTPYVKHSYQGLLIKTDSLGNEQWRRYPGSPDYDDCYCIVRNSPDGNYIVGTLLGVGQFYNSMYDFSKIRLMKFSNAGNVIWDKTYGGEKLSSTTTQVYVHPNGDIVTCGFYYPGFTDSVDTWGWILKTNNNGDSLWLREHYRYNGDLNTNRLNDLKPTPDGGYILVGQTDSFTYIPQSAWVLKVDSLGCAVPGCQYVGMKELIIKNEELEMFPNPFADELHIVLPDGFWGGKLEMYDVQGRRAVETIVPESHGNQTFTIQTPNLKPGMYLVGLTERDGRVWRRKVIRE